MELVLNLVHANKASIAKIILDYQPKLREPAIRRMSIPSLSKTAANFVKDYKLNPDDFPEL